MMKPTSILLALLIVAAAPLGVGCNAILGNDHGELAVDEGGVAFDGGLPLADGGGPAIDSGATDASSDRPASSLCSADKKYCFGQCVPLSDPIYGCGPDVCTPCMMNRATAICAAGACAIGTCDPGYFDCNKVPFDGCETDLSQATHCGTCNTTCTGTATPYCAPSGASFGCSTNCLPQAPTLCGSQCVDLTSSATHCGDCSTECAAVPNGQQACVSRACRLTCESSFHNCGGACVSNSDPNTCGGSCSPCPSVPNANSTCITGQCGSVCKPGFHACTGACVSNSDVNSCGTTSCAACPSTNATPACNGTACSFTCLANYDDCDRNPVNACEAPLLTDPTNCGVCGRSCGVNMCVNGVCQVPDAGPPDAGPG